MHDRCICNQCGADITGSTTEHFKNSLLSGGNCGGWHSGDVFSHYEHHDAAYEQQYIVDEYAWTETVMTGYKCACGATK